MMQGTSGGLKFADPTWGRDCEDLLGYWLGFTVFKYEKRSP